MNKLNFIPEIAGNSKGYWCTWWLQNMLVKTEEVSNPFGISGHSIIANTLTEENLKKYCFDTEFLKGVRGDMYLMLDLGWDVPYEKNFDNAQWELGSFDVSEKKFPSCIGKPVEKLHKLNELTQKAGFKGAAIWVPAHPYGEGKDNVWFSEKQVKEFYNEKLKWSLEAGIEYWKMDYGTHCEDIEFRRIITELGRKLAPGLTIEHCRNIGPLNDQYCPWEEVNPAFTGYYSKWKNGEVLESSVKIIEFCDMFRTYDVSFSLSVSTTLDRVSELMRNCLSHPQVKAILNCESEPYIGAVLGCSIGIMTCYLDYNNKIERQFIRALKWQRIAPPVGIGESNNFIDDKILMDTWDFREGSDWVDFVKEGSVSQFAPARVSRNMPLPNVKSDEDEVPYVICSKHTNGSTAVATLPRISVQRSKYYPKVSVEIDIENLTGSIGIFGHYKAVALNFKIPLTPKCRVWAQDLIGDEAVDITDEVILEEIKIIIPGQIISNICGIDGSIEDSPAIILKVLL